MDNLQPFQEYIDQLPPISPVRVYDTPVPEPEPLRPVRVQRDTRHETAGLLLCAAAIVTLAWLGRAK